MDKVTLDRPEGAFGCSVIGGVAHSGAEAGMPAKELCRQYDVSEASYQLWRSKVGGMSVSAAERRRSWRRRMVG
jgi:hypothetical protein